MAVPERREPTAAELYEQSAQTRRFGNDPRRQDVIDVPLDAGQRAVIMEALAHWHDSGPRSRSTREAGLAMLRIEAAVDAARLKELGAGVGWSPPPPVEDQLSVRSIDPGSVIDVEATEQ